MIKLVPASDIRTSQEMIIMVDGVEFKRVAVDEAYAVKRAMEVAAYGGKCVEVSPMKKRKAGK